MELNENAQATYLLAIENRRPRGRSRSEALSLAMRRPATDITH
jgi:hypothetical protein